MAVDLHVRQMREGKGRVKPGARKRSDRVRHVVQSAFNGKRIVIFSGGEAKDTPALLDEIRELAKGGGFGSIMGRNAFQRPKAEAVKLLQDVQEIFRKGG